MSLDGRRTRPAPEPRWITGRDARRDAHGLRARVDAVLVGAETVRADNPRLTVRVVRGARQPWRIVLTRSGRLSRQARLFSDRFAARTLIYRQKPLAAVLEDLGKRGITSVLIEGGGEVLGEALDQRLIDKVQIYLGPRLTGGPVIAGRKSVRWGKGGRGREGELAGSTTRACVLGIRSSATAASRLPGRFNSCEGQ